MATEFIKDTKFKPDSLERIAQANEIIEEYQAQGFSLTLRQLYYQFVARGIIPNTIQSYNNLGNVISNGRMAGMIDWEAIEDRTRGVEINAHWSSPKAGIEALRSQYRIDMWANQPEHVEVWIEKEALAGVIEPTCRQWDVPYLACRGYLSQSETWRAYRRIREYAEREIPTTIFHLGDHDPSGIDMTRDNRERAIEMLTFGDAQFPLGEYVSVKRLALNMDQVEQYKPPENPAKQTDARFASYAARFGDKSWELDALDPKTLAKLIADNVRSKIEPLRWTERIEQLKAEKETLDNIIKGLE